MRLKTKYMEASCTIEKGEYANGRIALIIRNADTDEPEMTASINLVDKPCPEGHAYIKDYSENAGIMAELIRHGIISKPIRSAVTGFVNVFLCKILV